MSDKAIKNAKGKLVEQAKRIAKSDDSKKALWETRKYNAMVMGMQSYCQIATNINLDMKSIARNVMTVLTNRLGGKKAHALQGQDGN
jgi:hypothetical protein